MLQAERSPIRVPDEVDVFNLPNPSSRTIALGSLSLKQKCTRNLPGGKGRPTRKADNLTAIREPTVYKMWEPQPLTTLRASAACTWITLPLPLSLQADARIMPQIRLWPLPLRFFTVYYSLIRLPLNAIYSELLIASF
jgi:hypothetical protein